MKRSIAHAERNDTVRNAASRFRAANLRGFGSVLHGMDNEGSDQDLPAEIAPGATLLNLGGAQLELEQ